MELRHLRYFLMAAEELNISRASARLNVSQPAVSRQIHDLEEELGVTLFHRERIGLKLTPAGETALVHAKSIFRKTTGLVDAMRPFQKEGDAVQLRLAYLPTALPVFLTEGLLRFQKARRDVCVMISEMTPREQEAALQAGDVDLALLGHPWPGLRQAFNVKVLHKTPVGVALPSGHRLAGRKSLDLVELREEAFVSLLESAFPTRAPMLAELFGKAGYDPLVIMKAKGLSELLGMVSTGAGIAVVPMELRHIAPAGLSFVRLKRPQFTLHFCAVWKTGDCETVIEALIHSLKTEA